MSTKCPHCGYCPTCGRSNALPYSPFPYSQPYWGYQIYNTSGANQMQSSLGFTQVGDACNHEGMQS